MKLYPEMFLSPWHSAVIILGLIAWIAMMVGGYDRKTVLKSTGMSLLAFYGIVTFMVVVISQEGKYVEEKMTTAIDERYEEIKDKLQYSEAPGVLAHVGAFSDEDGGTKWVIYAGNYSSQPFTGTLEIVVTDEDKQELLEKTYRDVSLEPGEKKEIDSVFTSKDIEQYWHTFEAIPDSP
ncbi:hypothetical protein [Paenibacillus lemnae]|uniref:Uncharacterized protein n=1 Tax=Paenibacillus lemnae TaxID=1330551 RepID=A0A848M2P7_PAELE|nr:hypothetical protein [Paenibacillus lemnae]NMO94510.1 hypothetical protein [Paenibacillus lemnae]